MACDLGFVGIPKLCCEYISAVAIGARVSETATAAMAQRTYDICVLGAYGSYGTLCCELLMRLEWSSGPLRVALAGRDTSKLLALQHTLVKAAEPSSVSVPRLEPVVHPKPVDANNHDDVLHLVQQARVLISFVRTSSADTVGTLVSACIAARCHYVDICALPSVLKHVAQRYHAAAADAGCYILPGAGFDYAITDVAAQRALQLYRAMYGEAPATLEKVLAIAPGPGGIVIKQHILADALEGVKAAAAAAPSTAHPQACSDPTHGSDHGTGAAGGADQQPGAAGARGEAPWAAADQQQEVLARMGAARGAPSVSAISTCASSSWRSLSSLSAAADAADDGDEQQDAPPGASQAASAAVEPNFRAALAPLVAKGTITRDPTGTLSTLALALVKPGQLLGHLVRYSPVLKRYSVPFPLGGQAEQFLLQRYQQLMVPGPAAAGGGVEDGGEEEGLLGVEGVAMARADISSTPAAAAAAAPELDTRLALPGMSLATWGDSGLMWALYYLTLVVWAAVGFLLARALPPLRPLYLRLLTAASRGHVTADVAAADTAMSQFTFKLFMVMGGCKVRPAPVQRSLTGVTTTSAGSALKSAGPEDSSSDESSGSSKYGMASAGEEAADAPQLSDSSRDAVRSRRPDQVAALHYPAAKAAAAHEEGHGLLHSSSRAAAVAALGAAGVQNEEQEEASEALPVLKVVCSGPAPGKWSQLTSLCAALAGQRLLLLSQQQGGVALPPAGEAAVGEADGGGSFGRSTAKAALDVEHRRDQEVWEDAMGAPDAAAVVTTSGFTTSTSSSSGSGGGSGAARGHTPLADTGKTPAVGGTGSSGSAVDHQLEEKPWVHPVDGIKKSRGQLALLPPFVDFSVTSMGSQEHQLLSAEYTQELGGAGVSGCGRRVPYGVVTPAVLLAGDPWFMCELHRLADVQLCVRL